MDGFFKAAVSWERLTSEGLIPSLSIFLTSLSFSGLVCCLFFCKIGVDLFLKLTCMVGKSFDECLFFHIYDLVQSSNRQATGVLNSPLQFVGESKCSAHHTRASLGAMPREGTGFQKSHRSIYHIYPNHVTCHPMKVASLPETTILQVALGFFQRGNLCGPQRQHVSVQKIPLGLSFPKTQIERK